jgi:hypothetical protein
VLSKPKTQAIVEEQRRPDADDTGGGVFADAIGGIEEILHRDKDLRRADYRFGSLLHDDLPIHPWVRPADVIVVAGSVEGN